MLRVLAITATVLSATAFGYYFDTVARTVTEMRNASIEYFSVTDWEAKAKSCMDEFARNSFANDTHEDYSDECRMAINNWAARDGKAVVAAYAINGALNEFSNKIGETFK